MTASLGLLFLAYLSLTLLLEAPLFWWGFRSRGRRVAFCVWLAANIYSYPPVFFFFPYRDWPPWQAELAAEVWAPVCELVVAWFVLKGLSRREAAAVVLANLFSWIVGRLLLG